MNDSNREAEPTAPGPRGSGPHPVRLRVYQNLLDSVAEEMGSALERTGFSPNIKERRDYSCAVFAADTTPPAMIAQAAHIPVHLGSTPLSVQAALEEQTLGPGDVVLVNDPYRGGTHLPDLTVVTPVFEPGRERPTFFVANRAHHADVGGAVRGSMALFEEIYQEGLRLPPIKIVAAGKPVRDVWSILLANMRQPDERRGDLRAQLGALRVGVDRLLALLASEAREELLEYVDHLLDAAERHVRHFFASIADGEYVAHDQLDSDGWSDDPVDLHVAVTIEGDRAHFDFTGTAPQVRGCLNANPAIALSAVFYVVRALAGREVPANQGCLRPVTLTLPESSILDPRPPGAVAGGNVETSQRLVDLLLRAFGPACPDRVPASSQGTMNNVTLGGHGDGRFREFSYYETIGGGAGGHPSGPGASGVHCHMTNTRNTPIEVLEQNLPVRVTEYSIRRGSGGAGQHPGGDGIVRELEMRAPVTAALLTERRTRGAPGLDEGEAGKPGHNQRVSADGTATDLPGKWVGKLAVGERLRIETPGGGGWGRASEDHRASRLDRDRD